MLVGFFVVESVVIGMFLLDIFVGVQFVVLSDGLLVFVTCEVISSRMMFFHGGWCVIWCMWCYVCKVNCFWWVGCPIMLGFRLQVSIFIYY